MREGWQQPSLAHSLSVPFSTCFSHSLSVPVSHLPLMSPFPCAWLCLSSTPLTSISLCVYFSLHIALFGTPLHLLINHFYCLYIYLCVCDKERKRKTCVCVPIYVIKFSVHMLRRAGVLLSKQCSLKVYLQRSSLSMAKLATTTTLYQHIDTYTPASLSSVRFCCLFDTWSDGKAATFHIVQHFYSLNRDMESSSIQLISNE